MVRWPRQRSARDLGLVAAFAAAYVLVRWLVTPEEPRVAIVNAFHVVSVEATLGLFLERALQAPILDHAWIVWALNAYYVALHIPPIAGLLWYVHRRRPEHWRFVRDVLVAFTVLGLLITALYPVAPPWFVRTFGISDTFEAVRFQWGADSGLGNPFAAMPSMHFGWALAAGVGFAALGRNRYLRAFGALHPILMAAAIVVTGNHYIVDGIASAILLGGGLVTVRWWHRRQARVQQAGPTRHVPQPAATPDPAVQPPRPPT